MLVFLQYIPLPDQENKLFARVGMTPVSPRLPYFWQSWLLRLGVCQSPTTGKQSFTPEASTFSVCTEHPDKSVLLSSLWESHRLTLQLVVLTQIQSIQIPGLPYPLPHSIQKISHKDRPMSSPPKHSNIRIPVWNPNPWKLGPNFCIMIPHSLPNTFNSSFFPRSQCNWFSPPFYSQNVLRYIRQGENGWPMANQWVSMAEWRFQPKSPSSRYVILSWHFASSTSVMLVCDWYYKWLNV